jgi:hypothetical protein
MGAYRYLVFPKNKQPHADEAAELQSYAPLFKNHIAIGTERKSGALAILFEAEAFDQAMAGNEKFEMLVRKWQTNGCELVDKLKFVKDPSALKPTHVHEHERHVSQESILRGKKYLAEEAIAKSLLGVQQTLERMSWLERVGRAVPYALMVCGMIGVIFAGFYIYHRVQNADRERRAETIERMTEEPIAQPLDPEPAS